MYSTRSLCFYFVIATSAFAQQLDFDGECDNIPSRLSDAFADEHKDLEAKKSTIVVMLQHAAAQSLDATEVPTFQYGSSNTHDEEVVWQHPGSHVVVSPPAPNIPIFRSSNTAHDKEGRVDQPVMLVARQTSNDSALSAIRMFHGSNSTSDSDDRHLPGRTEKRKGKTPHRKVVLVGHRSNAPALFPKRISHGYNRTLDSRDRHGKIKVEANDNRSLEDRLKKKAVPMFLIFSTAVCVWLIMMKPGSGDVQNASGNAQRDVGVIARNRTSNTDPARKAVRSRNRAGDTTEANMWDAQYNANAS